MKVFFPIFCSALCAFTLLFSIPLAFADDNDLLIRTESVTDQASFLPVSSEGKKMETCLPRHFRIKGMVCPSCERIVCRIARSLGAAEASADYVKGSLDLRCAENFDTEALSSALKSEGYTLLQREEEVSIPLRMLRVLLPISVRSFGT